MCFLVLVNITIYLEAQSSKLCLIIILFSLDLPKSKFSKEMNSLHKIENNHTSTATVELNWMSSVKDTRILMKSFD